MIALDASALLALLFRENGHEIVASHIDDCCLSTVNLSEVIARFARDGHDPQIALHQLAATSIEIVPFTANQAALAAAFLPPTRHLGLSLADRACLALALSRGIPALTADQVWQQANIGVEVVIIR